MPRGKLTLMLVLRFSMAGLQCVDCRLYILVRCLVATLDSTIVPRSVTHEPDSEVASLYNSKIAQWP